MLRNLAKSIFQISTKILPYSMNMAFVNIVYRVYRVLYNFSYYTRSIFVRLFGSRDRAEMMRRVHTVLPFSMVGTSGLEITDRIAHDINREGIEGDFVELGVARGGCAALLGFAAFAHSAPQRQLWLFDSFEGLPDPGPKDFLPGQGDKTGEHVRPLSKGSCLGQLEDVQDLILNKCKLPKEKVKFVKGWFENTVPPTKEKIKKIAALRIDGDWYESTKICLENLYGLVSPGGAVIVDDYYSCYGCKTAVDEFITKNNLKVDMHSDNSGGCYFYKT